MAELPGEGPWRSYLAWRGDEPVGSGGFKAGPDAHGMVEIGYLTFIPSRATGVATALAGALVAVARENEAAMVRAHTLPEHNPSTRVLMANGFTKVAEVVDPEDGPVWRWELPL